MTLLKTSGPIISPLWIFKAMFQLRKAECTLWSTIDAENLQGKLKDGKSKIKLQLQTDNLS